MKQRALVLMFLSSILGCIALVGSMFIGDFGHKTVWFICGLVCVAVYFVNLQVYRS